MAACVRYAPYAAPWNLAGFPAVVVPSGVRADGLPSAVQLVGPPGSELMLLALAGQLERLAPWRRHAPGWPRTGSRRPR
jgi:amidase